jgi:hypothetical protein
MTKRDTGIEKWDRFTRSVYVRSLVVKKVKMKEFIKFIVP